MTRRDRHVIRRGDRRTTRLAARTSLHPGGDMKPRASLLSIVLATLAAGVLACSGSTTGAQCTEAAATVSQRLEEGSCIGSPKSCSSYAAEDCDQEGCSADVGDVDTLSDDRCTGTPPLCSSRDSKHSCQRV